MPERTAKIAEVFKSIQGEGPYQGHGQVFVRFFGCNLSCCYCDTKLTFYKEKTISELLGAIDACGGCDFISITGGEPLLQVDFLNELLLLLKEKEKKIYLETNGILYGNLSKIINYVDIISMDFKLPSSTKGRDLWTEHQRFLGIAKQKEMFVKTVVTSDTSLDDINKSIELIKQFTLDIDFILQPQHPFENLLQDKLLVFLSLCKSNYINAKIMSQLHKKLGVQ